MSQDKFGLYACQKYVLIEEIYQFYQTKDTYVKSPVFEPNLSYENYNTYRLNSRFCKGHMSPKVSKVLHMQILH